MYSPSEEQLHVLNADHYGGGKQLVCAAGIIQKSQEKNYYLKTTTAKSLNHILQLPGGISGVIF